MSKVFVNLSNLHTNKWPEDRLQGALDLSEGGEIINVAFPVLSAEATREEVYKKSDEAVEKVLSYKPDIVFCMGEYSMCFRIVTLLKQKGIKVVTVCNERVISNEDGKTISGFRFIQFREF